MNMMDELDRVTGKGMPGKRGMMVGKGMGEGEGESGGEEDGGSMRCACPECGAMLEMMVKKAE